MKLDKLKYRILELLHKNSDLTAKEIAERLNHDHDSVKRLVAHYHRAGLLSRDGVGIKGLPYKYRLTKSGEARLRFFERCEK